MASLLERMNITGPVRRQKPGSRRAMPYEQRSSQSKGDVNGQWGHDLFDNHNNLMSRISNGDSKSSTTSLAQRAVSAALGQPTKTTSISIQGAASKSFNCIRVSGLAPGTTPEDVATIFKSCGHVIHATLEETATQSNVVVRITFKEPTAANTAVSKFHGQHADGKVLSVTKVGQAAGRNLAGRMGGSDGLDLVRVENNLDILLDSSQGSNSKMRSDSLAKGDPRAHIMVAPPGTNPGDYIPQAPRATRGRGRGRPGHISRNYRRRGDLTSRMDVT